MGLLQRESGGGNPEDREHKADVSDLTSAAERARAALAQADSDLEARKEALRTALRGPVKTNESIGVSRSRSFFDNPAGDFCSC